MLGHLRRAKDCRRSRSARSAQSVVRRPRQCRIATRMRNALRLLPIVLVISVATAAEADVPSVTLSTWEQGTNGTRVEFAALRTATDVTDAVSLDDETSDGAFEYTIDTDGILWADECRCFRYYVVLVKSRASGTITRHKFKAVPSGSFDDQ